MQIRVNQIRTIKKSLLETPKATLHQTISIRQKSVGILLTKEICDPFVEKYNSFRFLKQIQLQLYLRLSTRID